MKTLTSVLSSIGDSNMQFQLISESLIHSKDKIKTKDTEITFATNQTNTANLYNDDGKVGVVVWVDKDDWNKEVKA